MTPFQAVSEQVLGLLQLNAGIVADTAPSPTGGPGVYSVRVPQGASYLPAVVYTVSLRQGDSAPQGQSHLSFYDVTVLALAVGSSWKHSLVADAIEALHGFVGEYGGYTMQIARSGDVPAYFQTVDGKEYRAVGVRFGVTLSHPL